MEAFNADTLSKAGISDSLYALARTRCKPYLIGEAK